MLINLIDENLQIKKFLKFLLFLLALFRFILLYFAVSLAKVLYYFHNIHIFHEKSKKSFGKITDKTHRKQIIMIPDINLFLASSVHDMKNSINILSNYLKQYLAKHVQENDPDLENISQMMEESQRINGNLIQLLTLYKLGQDSYPFSPETHNLEEFVDETISHIDGVLNSKDVTLEIEMDDNIFWEFDYDLLMGVIIHALNSAINYTKDKVMLEIYTENNEFLVINVEDNGRGFPQRMIESIPHMLDENYAQSSNFISGSTGLGLYFSAVVANLHENNNKKGNIALSNGGKLGGGVFTIKLP